MPRVLQIVNRLNIGGVIYQPAYLTKYLQPEFETFLAVGTKEDSEASFDYFLKETGIEPLVISEMSREIRPQNDWKSYGAMKRLIREIKPDIVHTHAAKAGAIGRAAAASCGVPAILHTFHGHYFHSYFSPLKTRFFLEIERQLAKKTSAIITVSHQNHEEITGNYLKNFAEKTHLVEYGFELEKFSTDQDLKNERFRAKWNIPMDCLTVVIVGRVVPIKNHGLFLRAFKQFADRFGKPTRAIIVGDGDERPAMETLCQDLGLKYGQDGSSCDVIFTSWQKEIDEVLAGTDILCLTSLNEGAPVSLIEAQAASCPIVATRAGGVPNVVEEGKTALLAPSNDVDKVSSQIHRLASDSALRAQMGAAGFEYVMDRFSVNRMVREMREIYLSLLERSVV